MAQETDTTFGGRVIWGINAASPHTDMLHDKLKRRFEADLPDLDGEKRQTVNQMLMTLSLTETIDFNFDGKEKRMLRQLKTNWEQVTQMTTEQLGDFLYRLPFAIRRAWVSAVNEEQVPFEVDPAQLPTSELSAEQREELKDPTSPLA